MKNLDTILKELGIELTDEQKEKLKKEHNENYKTIKEYQDKVDKIETLEKTVKATEETLKTAQDDLKKFEGVDAETLNVKIKELEAKIESNEKEYQAKIDERDFSDKIAKKIAESKGKNVKAITALLDIEALKGSKNQDKDIEDAIKALTEAEDSKMLFGDPDPAPQGQGNPIGTVRKGANNDDNGSLTDALHEYYNN